MYTRGSHILALQVQGEGNPFAGSGGLITLIADTTPINQAVLVILLLYSVASLAIIFQKIWTFRVLERDLSEPDVVIRPSTTRLRWYAFHKPERYVEAGRRAAESRIAAIKALVDAPGNKRSTS